MQWYMKVLREFANFEGRARRTEYWMFVLFNALFTLVCVAIDTVVSVAAQYPLPILTLAYSLAMIVPSIAVVVRRLHDTDKSGWWFLISFVPFGNIVLLVFMCLDGNPMPNAWGPSPKYAAPGYRPQYA